MSNLVLLYPNCHRQLHANSKILLLLYLVDGYRKIDPVFYTYVTFI